MTLDLSLPATCPPLCHPRYYECNQDLAAFALYTLVDIPESDLSKLLLFLNHEWCHGDDDIPPIVRTPKTYNFTGKTLKDIVKAQTEMDMQMTPLTGAQANYELGWHPEAFLVVTTRDCVQPGKGLLLVFMDDYDNEFEQLDDPEVRRMDKCFLPIEEAPMVLSSFQLTDMAFMDAKAQFGGGDELVGP
ncbi:hypothetical protein P170DRAFT_441781 [Aspergillus steynii IBT 23096]|uniref:Uncharacterized protein n=1 Tax=Aspergillus steynii IBT 23096 TaxID=1392250 RepID=A0A2I2FRU7_9EURO|nr:uncharacterized protein P170DRAFT_441781 [Aspergillus steynii IBT 23096]PLB43354.1 hypothetical protein P170DRAFT_441781 [Aspergillus steynii IBT 23096]